MINIIDYRGGSKNTPPIITNLKVAGEPTQSSIKISYHVEDAENQIVRHYLTIPNLYDKKEITPEVGYDKNDFECNITGLEMGTNYSIMITCSDGINEGKSDAIQGKTEIVYVYGVRIDENNSNPETAVTYTDQSIGQIPARGSNDNGWLLRWPFNKIRPVGFKNGKVFKEIQKNDYTKYIDETPVLEDVDVMIEFPKIYWKCYKEGNIVNIKISNKKNDNSYVCPPYTIGTKEVDNIYISAYEGCDMNGVLRSVRDKIVIGGKTLSDFRQFAQKNGVGYQQFLYYQNEMLCILYLIMYKDRDIINALGKGRINGSRVKTGILDNKGMLYGENTGNYGVKFLGIENWYANMGTWIDGFYLGYWDIYISNQSEFNDNGTNYEICGKDPNSSITSGYTKGIIGDNRTCFYPSNVKSSARNDYCSYVAIDYYAVPYLNGSFVGIAEDFVSPLGLILTSDQMEIQARVSARLSYIG